MANIASLAVSLTAYTSAFDKKMRKSRSTVRVFKSAVDRVDKALLRIGVVAAAAAAAGLVLVTKNAFQSMDAIAKLSARIDVSTEFLVAYGHAATLAGTSSEEFSKAIEIFVRRLGELTQGTGEAKYGLEALGLNMKDMLAMNPEQAFAKVADGIKGLGTQAEKAAVAYRFFGRSGSKMLNLLESDTSDVFSKAEKLNILYSKFDAKKIQDANDAMANLKKMIGGVGQSIAIKVAPKITQMITAFLESGDAAQKLRNIVDKVIEKTIAFGKTALTILKWASAIYVGVKAASILIAVLKGVSVSMAIVQALGGPIGWASLAIGLTTAAVAGIAVKKSFDKVGDSIKGGMDDAKNSIDKMKASLEAAGKTKVDTIDTTALAEKAKAFDELATKAERLRESLKTPVEKFKEMREELDKMIQSKLISQQEYDKAINKYSKDLLNISDPHKEAMENQAKALEDMSKRADQLSESLKSPIEKLKDFRTEIEKIRDAGFLTQLEFDKLLKNKSSELLKLDSSIPDMQIKSYRSENVDVTALGSSREISPIVKKQEELVEIGKETNRHLEKLVKKEGLE